MRGRHRLSRAVSIALCISLLSTSAPAAPPVLKGLGSNLRVSASLWLQSSGLLEGLKAWLAGQGRPAPQSQEKQSARDARVARIEISPADVTVRAGEQVRFAAIAYDAGGAVVGGVRMKWKAFDSERGRPTRISPSGRFEPKAAGTYQVSVEGARQTAQVTVKVLEGEKRRRDEPPVLTKESSSRDLPPEAAPQAKAGRKRPARTAQSRRGGEVSFVAAAFAREAAEPAAPAMLAPYEWNQDNYMYADDPGNGRGDPPGTSPDNDAGSGNFQIHAPVYGLAGRGIDLSLELNYNSRVWSKTGSQMTYDIDKDWPAPGWSLGFGKMVGMNTSGSMLVEGDGTRHSFKGTVQSYSWGATYFTGHTADGTLIDFWSYSYNGNISSGWAKMPDGTVVDYGAAGNGAIYPTQITDPNGNYVTITYVNNSGPRIQTVTDTLGRVVNFHYDGYGLLTAVTAPGLGGGTRTLVRLHYHQHSLGYAFAYWLTPSVRDPYPWVLDAIYYPGTGTGYWFGDSDSYSSYGMIAKVSERRGMSFSSSGLNDQGWFASAGSPMRQTTYDYPMTPNSSLTDAPTYPKMTEWWDGMDTAPPETFYSVQMEATPRRIEVTHPDGTRSIQLSFNAPGQYNDGMVYQDETRDSSGNLLQSSYVTYEPGAYDSARPTRIEVTDHELNKKTAKSFEYGPAYNQVTAAHEYDYSDTTPTVRLRTTRTQYENGTNYTNRHIFNLARVVEIYAGDGVTRVARVEYQYDGRALQNAPGVVQHFDSYNPYAPQYWVDGSCYEDCSDGWCHTVCEPGYWTSDYNPATDFRGNITSTTTYADAGNLAGAYTDTRTYDINGNLVATTSSCCDQTAITYTLDTQYAYATSAVSGSPTDAGAQLRTSATHDFNTGLTLTETDANGRTRQTTYDASNLRPQEAVSPTGARTVFAYDEGAMKVTETVYTAAPSAGGAVASQNVKYFNGAGLVRREEALGAGGAWDVVETKYDKFGRVWQQTAPYRNGVDVPRWNETTYDALGRVRVLRAPDGSQSFVYYNEPTRPSAATGEPGETVRTVDPWGRERWGRTDATGRLAEVVEPDPGGDGTVAQNGLRTLYRYNTLGNLVEVQQGSQLRRFRYDSLGRLTHQKVAEAGATLDDAGNYVGAGTWSSVFTYDGRSNLATRTDARGVVTNFIYNNDPLGRLQSITFTIPAARDTSSPVPATPSINFEYRSNGGGAQMVNVTQLQRVTTAGVSTEDYAYDAEGRLTEERLTLSSRPYNPFVVNYSFDTLDRVTDVVYPPQYQNGVANPARKTVHQDYDAASRVSGLKVDGADYASQIDYNASSFVTSLRVGWGGSAWKTERYEYDPVTGMMSRQYVLRGDNTPLLDLSYDYLRPGTTSGRTGQLTRVVNNLNPGRSRTFEYDTLGRLTKASSGSWVQRYTYDRYGNRTSVSSSTSTAALPASHIEAALRDQLAANDAPPLPEQLTGRRTASVTDAGTALLGRWPGARAGLKSAQPPAVERPTFKVPDPSERDEGTKAAEGAADAGAGPVAAQQPATSTRPSQQATPLPTPSPVTTTTEAPPADEVGGPNVCVECDPSANEPPVAVPGGPYSGAPGQSVQFDGSGSYDNDGYITTYLWNFGDGTTGSGMAPAHAYASPGTYTVTLRVRDNQLAYSTTVSTTVTVANPTPVNNAAFVSQSVPTQMNAGQQYTVSVTMNNNGTKTWTAADLHRLGSQNPQDNSTWGVGRVEVPSSISPGQNATFTFTVTAPSAPGTYNFQWRMVQDAVEWFGDYTPNVVVTVTQPVSGSCAGGVPCDGISTLSYDPSSNRINTPGWLYDAAGNQIRAQRDAGTWLRYEYDAAGRMVAVRNDSGALLAAYTYGSSSERLVADEQGTRTYFAWGANGVVAEYTETPVVPNSPQWSKNYIYLGARLLATQQPGGGGEVVQFHHPDLFGTRIVSNASDAGYFEQTTFPFGTPLDAESSGATNRRFSTYDRSPLTNLDYSIHRHYDSAQGRFTQVDPIGMGAVSLDNPQTLNLYTYCANDPVNNDDPNGLFFGLGKLFHAIGKLFKKVLKWAVIVVAAVVAVAFIAATFGAGSFASFLMLKIVAPAVKILGVLTGIRSPMGIFGPGGTPIWNPNAGTGLTTSRWRDFVFHQQQEDEPIDIGEVIVINTNICRNGNQYPYCKGIGQPSFLGDLVPIYGPGRSAIDHFQNGRWGWGLLRTAEAISDIFLVKSLVKAGGKLVWKGGTEVVERAMSRAELKATLETGLVRGGREGEHYVTTAVNNSAQRARQRLALPQTPELKVTLEVPKGVFSAPTRVAAKYGMPGGGLERVATGKVPAKVLRVKKLRR